MEMLVECAPAPIDSTKINIADCVHLRRTLNLIDYERTVRMRELDNQRRQFLHHRLGSQSRTSGEKDNQMPIQNKREEIKKQIQREKDAELKHQVSLLKRKVELMDSFKKKQQESLSKSKAREFVRKGLMSTEEGELYADEIIKETKDENPIGLPNYKLNNRDQIAKLYQRGFEIIKRKREENQNPFVASVNSILEKLRTKTENSEKDGDPFNLLSKSVLTNFATDDNVKDISSNANNDNVDVKNTNEDLETVETEAVPLCSHNDVVPEAKNETAKLQTRDHINNVVSNTSDRDSTKQNEVTSDLSNDRKQSLKYTTSKALRLWEAVRREQKAATDAVNKQEKEQKEHLKHSGRRKSNTQAEYVSALTLAANLRKNENDEEDSEMDRPNSSLSCQKQDVGLKGKGTKTNNRQSNNTKQLHNQSPRKGIQGSRETNETKSVGNENTSSINSNSQTTNDKSLSPSRHSQRIKTKSIDKGTDGLETLRQKNTKTKISVPSSVPVKSPRKSSSPTKSHSDTRRNKTPDIKILLTNECIQECNETNVPNTTIVVHEESDGDDKLMSPPIHWDRGYRYSLTPSDNEIIDDDFFSSGMLQKVMGKENYATGQVGDKHLEQADEIKSPIQNNLRSTTKYDYQALKADRKEEQPIIGSLDLSLNLNPKSKDIFSNDTISTKSHPSSHQSQQCLDLDLDYPITGRSDVLESAMSNTNTMSEMTSNSRTASRLGLKSKYGKTKRLSMETRGSLRALSCVMKEEIRQQQELESENVLPESMAYRVISDAIAGAVAGAEEQAKRLANIRRVGLGLRMSNTGNNERLGFRTMRRNTIDAPGYPGADADVTDPVYRFLRHRNQSKTMRRHKTLSSVELKLLAHAPGEDIRRHSFSSHHGTSSSTSSRRNSSSMNSYCGDGSHRMSIISSSRKVSCDLPVVPETESSFCVNLKNGGNSSASARSRNGSASASTRPHSVAITDDCRDVESRTSVDSNVTQGWRKEARSYSWAPDVSETKEWHVLAMELLAQRGGTRNSARKFKTVNHMLQWLGEEYKRQTAAMMYEELRYCSYLRLPKHQQPAEFRDSDVEGIFKSGSTSPESCTENRPDDESF